MNTPSPSPSGLGLSVAELSRMTLRAESAITNPKYWLCDEESPTSRLPRTPPMSTPTPNPRSDPLRTVTPSWRSLKTPMSHGCRRGQRRTGLPSPEIVCPFRSSVMSSAPMMMPLLGQPVRSRSSVVSAVIVSPHLRPAGGDWPAAAVTPDRASSATTESNLSGAIGVLSWLDIADRSYDASGPGETRLATVFATWSHGYSGTATVASPDAAAR